MQPDHHIYFDAEHFHGRWYKSVLVGSAPDCLGMVYARKTRPDERRSSLLLVTFSRYCNQYVTSHNGIQKPQPDRTFQNKGTRH